MFTKITSRRLIMNVSKGNVLFFIVVLIIGISGTVMAGGDVEIDLRCDSPSVAIKNAIGNNGYNGVAQRYLWSTGSYFSSNTNMVYRITDDGYVDVAYREVKPYVLRDDVFKANPNYYRAGMSGSGSEGWWIFSDSGSSDFPPKQYHQYATPTPSKNSAVIGTSYGQIKLTYKRYDGTTGEKVINVQVQKRECEAYNNGKWREVSPGRWEMR
jgi:hypothetical protein